MSSGESFSMADRARHLLASHLSLAIATCVVVALFGGSVAFQELSGPTTTTEQHVSGTWTTDSSFTHQATVQRDTTAFDSGTVLENRSVYFSRVSPDLEGSHVYTHGGDAEEATVTTELQIVHRSVDETGDGTVEYWRVADTLATEEATLAPGESLRTNFAFNVSEQIQRSAEIQSELDSSAGRPELLVVATTRAETTLDGESFEETRSDRLVVDPRAGTYGVSANTSGQQTHDAEEFVEVPVETDPVAAYGGILLALVGLAGAAGLVFADRNDHLSVPPETVAALQWQAERDEFDEWISVGQVPPAGDDERVVTVDTLEDLVDIAIDCERRVIEGGGSFVVLDGETRYVYESAPNEPAAMTGEKLSMENSDNPVE